MQRIPPELYDPIENRYHGVYPSKSKWQALARPKTGKLTYLGTFSSPEEAARKVAEFYDREFGKGWLAVVLRRKVRDTKVRKLVKTRYFVRTVLWEAIEEKDGVKVRVTPDMVGMSMTVSTWNPEGGWATKSAALVALRIYRLQQGTPPTSSASEPRPSPS